MAHLIWWWALPGEATSYWAMLCPALAGRTSAQHGLHARPHAEPSTVQSGLGCFYCWEKFPLLRRILNPCPTNLPCLKFLKTTFLLLLVCMGNCSPLLHLASCWVEKSREDSLRNPMINSKSTLPPTLFPWLEQVLILPLFSKWPLFFPFLEDSQVLILPLFSRGHH